ncbi:MULTISPECIES: hypothetical protein [Paraliobacillus]|uniref:hypothetical protein n=1 Tax=Paraliobacillus TaxID=200903 RepID=UPI000DD2E507|nr:MULTISPECIES: hypothetical protein [Paraliobacillus]
MNYDSLMQEISEMLKHEKKQGLLHHDFMALVNIAKELLPLGYSINNIEDIWTKYRLNNLEQNQYRLDPDLFEGFDEVIGEENIIECIKNKGVFGTFHYGAYRYVPLYLNNYVQSNVSSLDIVVDRDSFESENGLVKWKKLRTKADVNYIISEEYGSGLKLLRTLKQRGNILLYLDGNTGSGEDSNPMSCKHITSRVKMRSGIYRLVSLLKKDLCIIVADQPKEGYNRLIAYKPFSVNKRNIELGVEDSYSLFRKSILERPELWRFWYRHHNYVEQWQALFINSVVPSPQVQWVEEETGLGIDLRTGNVYQTETI